MPNKKQLDEGLENVKVLVVDKVDEHMVETLSAAGMGVDYFPGMEKSKIIEVLGNYDVLVGRTRMPIGKDMIDAGRKLRIIGRAGVGIENIDVVEARRRGIKVINVPGAATESVVELALSLTITALRNTFMGMSKVRKGSFAKELGGELAGKTVGIIGFGRIGTRFAEVLKAFNAKVIVTDIIDYREKAAEMGVGFVSLEELLEKADIISVHINMEANDRPVIDTEELARIRAGAILINTARGAAVSRDAVYTGLKGGTLAFYGADVMWEEPPKDPVDMEIIGMDNVAITPHIGANTREAQERIARTLGPALLDAIREIVIK